VDQTQPNPTNQKLKNFDPTQPMGQPNPWTTVVRCCIVVERIGFIGPAVCLVVTGWIECDAVGAVAMIVIAVGLSGISMAGWAVNHLDLAPPFAGFLC